MANNLLEDSRKALRHAAHVYHTAPDDGTKEIAGKSLERAAIAFAMAAAVAGMETKE